MSKQKLLICFDAFGTLFAPRWPVHVQYASVARSVGLGPFSDADVENSFKKALSKESKENPNFGKVNGMDAEQWWTNIIKNTFKPLAKADNSTGDIELPKELVPKLLHRFWSKEGYMLMPDVESLLQTLRKRHQTSHAGDTVVGIVTNSDNRVPDILRSLGIRVSQLRHGSQPAPEQQTQDDDIDFSVMSFDVGHEKPDQQIFKAAEEMLGKVLLAKGIDVASNPTSWQKVYVGDEYGKDVLGAVGAGWRAVLIGQSKEANQHSDVRWLDDQVPGNLLDEFKSTNAVGFSRLGKLTDWLPLQHYARSAI